MIRSDIGTT